MLPIVNENDTVADDEIRYGDNDRIAALVANMVHAEVLVLLTDTAGLFTADPRLDAEASLIEEIAAVDEALESVAGGTGSERGSGGMASKLAAAKIASWSGVRAVIAAADEPGVVMDALDGKPVGTVVQPHRERLPSRKLWIASRSARPDARSSTTGRAGRCFSQGRSLLAAGVRDVEGEFDVDAAVEVVGADGRPFAKGLVRYPAARLRAVAGLRSGDLPEGSPAEVIHRDDLVLRRVRRRDDGDTGRAGTLAPWPAGRYANSDGAHVAYEVLATVTGTERDGGFVRSTRCRRARSGGANRSESFARLIRLTVGASVSPIPSHPPRRRRSSNGRRMPSPSSTRPGRRAQSSWGRPR